MRPSRTVLAGLTAVGTLIAAAPAVAAPVQSAQSTFRADATNPTVVRAPGAQRATFLAGTVSAGTLGGGSVEAVASQALSRYGAGVGVTRSQARLQEVTTSPSGTQTARFTQQVGDVPVWDSGITVTLGGGNALRAIAASVKTGVSGVATTPTVTAASAEQTVDARLNDPSEFKPTQLVVYKPEGAGAKLAWAVDRISDGGAKHDVTMVDATDGSVVDVINRIADAKNRAIYDMQGRQYFLPGTLVRSEGGASNGDRDADDAYNGTGATYDYYRREFGRDSYDNRGARLVSSVNYGRNYRNAFWNGQQMTYGDGFAVLDVTAHELTHAVTEYTAGLVYRDQSGALNESMSDMAAWDVDSDDTTIGEDLPIGAIRDMSNPEAYRQPSRTANYVCTSEDNGGVHYNSGIPNKVYSNLVSSIGRKAAGQVRYQAQVSYLTPNASFADARAAFVSAAGDTGANASAVANAWNAQGVTANWAPSC